MAAIQIIKAKIMPALFFAVIIFLLPLYSFIKTETKCYNTKCHFVNECAESCERKCFDSCSVNLGFPLPYFSNGEHYHRGKVAHFYPIGLMMDVAIWLAFVWLFLKRRYRPLFYFSFLFILWVIFLYLRIWVDSL